MLMVFLSFNTCCKGATGIPRLVYTLDPRPTHQAKHGHMYHIVKYTSTWYNSLKHQKIFNIADETMSHAIS